MAPTKKTPTKPTRALRPRGAKTEAASASTPKAKKVKTVAPKKEKIVAPKKVTKTVAPKKVTNSVAPKKAPAKAVKKTIAPKETEATRPKKKGRPAKIEVADKTAPAPTTISAAVAKKILQAAGEITPEPTPKPKTKTPKKDAPKSKTKNTPKKIVKSSPDKPTSPTFVKGGVESPTYIKCPPTRAPKSPLAVKKSTPGRGRPKTTPAPAPAPASSREAFPKEISSFDDETNASAQKSMDDMNATHRKLWNNHLKLHKDAEKKGKPNPCPEGQCPGTEPFKPLPLPAALQIGKDLLAGALAQSQSKGVSFLDDREETDSVESVEDWTPPKNLPLPPKSPRSPAKIKSPFKTKNTPNTISKSPGKASPVNPHFPGVPNPRFPGSASSLRPGQNVRNSLRDNASQLHPKSPPKSPEKVALSKTQLALFAHRAIAYDNTLEDPEIPEITCPDCHTVAELGLDVPPPSDKTRKVKDSNCFCSPPWKQVGDARKVMEKKGYFTVGKGKGLGVGGATPKRKGRGEHLAGRMQAIKTSDEKSWMIEFESLVREAMEGFEWKGGVGKTTSEKFGPGGIRFHPGLSEDRPLW